MKSETPSRMIFDNKSSKPTEIYPPEQILNTCSKCGVSGGDLIICPNCSMRAHCSEKCRNEDILHGPKFCISRIHLELGQMYPFIAWAAELTRLQHLTTHPVLWYEIVDAPNRNGTGNSRAEAPSTCVVRYRDGHPIPYPSDPIRLKFPIKRVQRLKKKKVYSTRKKKEEANLEPRRSPFPLLDWFPTCPDLEQRAYLWRRITRNGHLLPLVMGMGIAVLLEFFSMTQETPIPPCLHFLGKPIQDFGICRGKIRVDPHRILSYLKEGSNGPPIQLQNPDQHFWLYFTTEGEEERLYLDIGLFVYGYKYHVVDAEKYLPLQDHKYARGILQRLLSVPAESAEFLDPYAPVHFTDKKVRGEMLRQGFRLHDVSQQFSILRDEDLKHALDFGALRISKKYPMKGYPWRFTPSAVSVLYKFMERVDLDPKTLGKTDVEMMFLLDTIYNGTRIFQKIFQDETWKNLSNPRIENCKWELGLNPGVHEYDP